MNICSKENTGFYPEFHDYVEVLKLQVEIQMEISVEVDGKFKLAAIAFQFGNLIESTIPVFHYLAQYMQDLYESRNFISLFAPLSCSMSILLHLLKMNAKGYQHRVSLSHPTYGNGCSEWETTDCQSPWSWKVKGYGLKETFPSVWFGVFSPVFVTSQPLPVYFLVTVWCLSEWTALSVIPKICT